MATHRDNGASGFYHELFKRPLERDEIVCWKALVTVHEVAREGHQKVYYKQIPSYWIRSLKTVITGFHFSSQFRTLIAAVQKVLVILQFLSKRVDVGALIVLYNDLLIHKFQFHHQFPDLPGDLNPDVVHKRLKLSSQQR